MRISDWSSDVCSSDLFVAPGIGWLIRTCFNASEYGITPEVAETMGYKRELEVAAETLRKMHKRGIRILPGGDYGFAWMPHGTNANDLQYFVDYIGMTPTEALIAATTLGGQIMQRPNDLGQLKRSEEHTSELQSLMRTSYAVFCLKQKNIKTPI